MATEPKSSTAFTNGPWQAFPSASKERPIIIDTALGVESDNVLIIAEVARGKQGDANARLIAAAPDLFAALCGAFEICAGYADHIRGVPAADLEQHPYLPALEDVVNEARAALTKARGEQP